MRIGNLAAVGLLSLIGLMGCKAQKEINTAEKIFEYADSIRISDISVLEASSDIRESEVEEYFIKSKITRDGVLHSVMLKRSKFKENAEKVESFYSKDSINHRGAKDALISVEKSKRTNLSPENILKPVISLGVIIIILTIITYRIIKK